MTTAEKKQKSKPKRPCPFCSQVFVDLRKHLLQKHKAHPRIKTIVEKEKAGLMTKKERIDQFALLRKEGMFLLNKELLAQRKDSEIHCVRRAKGTKVKCSSCHGFYSDKYYYKHRKGCKVLAETPKPVHTKQIIMEQPTVQTLLSGKEEEWRRVYETLTRDDLFNIIDNDESIKLIGKKLYQARKPNKKKQAKIKSRNAMRRLANLKLLCPGVDKLEELFSYQHGIELESAIKEMCNADEGNQIKAGLMSALGPLIKSCCKILIPHFNFTGKRDTALNIREYYEYFSAPTNYAMLFSEAEYCLKERRQRENRKPKSLPDEENVRHLENFMEQEIIRLSSSECLTKKTYVQLRKVTLAHLTLLNCKRGSEVARMLIQDYQERDTWINNRDVTEEDREILDTYAVTFLMGKGMTLVPVIIPRVYEAACNALASEQNRKNAGVSPTNRFLFPYTEYSEDECIGYNEVRDVCQKVGIPVVTATSMRHRAATSLWKMQGLTEEQLKRFVEYLGHSMDIDKNIYACPPALATLRDVTPIIENFRKASPSASNNVARTATLKPSPCTSRNVSRTASATSKASVSMVNNLDNKSSPATSKENEQDSVATTSATQVPIKSAQKNRPYTRWDERSSSLVQEYFRDYITGKMGKIYPGKAEILIFQEQCKNSTIKEMPWATVKVKVVNEKKTLMDKLKKMEK